VIEQSSVSCYRGIGQIFWRQAEFEIAIEHMNQAVAIFKDTGFSRLPVYSGDKGNVTGLLNVKEVFPVVLEQRQGVSIPNLMHEPYFAPETAKIDDLLRELQKRKIHMGFVLDEYGEFAGIITVEDILEELVGEILDEFDQDEPEIQTVEDGIYLVDGQVRVKDANERLGISLPQEGSYETIGGLVLGSLDLPRGQKSLQPRKDTTDVVAVIKGVIAAEESVKKREGGIIWHTQGSGKSIVMVWLAKWILEKLLISWHVSERLKEIEGI
jgi:Mg2+/Co2+ transporter CorB